jgi:hypothetical protein
MLRRKRKKARRRTKYKKITFKLSARQEKSLFNYCRARKTTPVKLIKKIIRPYINGFDLDVPEEFYVTENQLELFSEDQPPESMNHKSY